MLYAGALAGGRSPAQTLHVFGANVHFAVGATSP